MKKAMNRKQKKPRKTAIPDVPRVLLLIETSTGYGRGLLEGIGRWISEHGRWSIFVEERGLETPPPRWLKNWQGDGVISRTATPVQARQLRNLHLPVVDLLGIHRSEPAKVHADNVAVGQLAAKHLLDCGLREFGFFGLTDIWWITTLYEGFCGELKKHGHACHTFPLARRTTSVIDHWNDAQRLSVIKWLGKLSRPAGIFAANSFHARCLLDICRDEGIAVPDQVAIMGANDDQALCGVSYPPLTAIDLNLQRIGYEAAAMLDRMMANPSTSEETLWIPPLRVIARQSTDVVAIDDADLVRAIRFIREHACRGINVSDVVTAACVSRRVLEQRFRQILNQTPKQAILKVQIDKAKSLLAQRELPIEVVAQKSGFTRFRHFAEVFRREVGVTPRDYRQRRQAHHQRADIL